MSSEVALGRNFYPAIEYEYVNRPENAVIEPGGDPKFLVFCFGMAAFTALAGSRLIYLAATRAVPG